jgi:carbonic anhydrase
MLKTTAFATSLIFTLAAQTHAGAAQDWAYDGAGAPEAWGELSAEFQACKAGAEQSPIDIDSGGTINGNVPYASVVWTPSKPDIVNTDHSIQANVDGQGGYVRLNGTGYELTEYHFHASAEHTVDGRRMPMEIHFVNTSEDGDIVVIGVFVVEGAANSALEAAFANLPAGAGETATSAVPIDPAAMLPADRSVYRYKGSLTTPPCSEVVTWNLMQVPVTASAEQIDAFRALYANNFRPVQDQNRRYVISD